MLKATSRQAHPGDRGDLSRRRASNSIINGEVGDVAMRRGYEYSCLLTPVKGGTLNHAQALAVPPAAAQELLPAGPGQFEHRRALQRALGDRLHLRLDQVRRAGVRQRGHRLRRKGTTSPANSGACYRAHKVAVSATRDFANSTYRSRLSSTALLG
jgi:hypothetical protein